MKIVYLLTTADAAGGTERTIITQANGMVRRGHEVELLSVFRDRAKPHFPTLASVRRRSAVDRRDQSDVSGAPSLLVPTAWDTQFTRESDRAFPQLLMDCDADIVVAPTPPLAALAVQFLPARCRVVQQEHRVTELRGETRLPLDRFISEVDCLVSLTERSRRWIADHYGPKAPRLEVIPNAIPNDFRPQASGQEKRVISAGRLVKNKRFDHLIGAFAIALPSAPDWTLRIYGSGPHRPALHRRINSLGLAETVEIVPNVTDMSREWPKGSIAALTSQVEGHSMVGLEAIAAGLPFVSYDCPNGPAEIIVDRVNGRLVPNSDQAALACALSELMTDDSLRIRMGAQALESATRFDEEAINDRWEKLFAELIRGDGRSSAHQRFNPGAENSPTANAPQPVSAALSDMLPAAQREANLRLVLQALHDIPVLAENLPTSLEARSRIAVSEDHRQAVFTALDALSIKGTVVENASEPGVLHSPTQIHEQAPAVARILFYRLLSNPLASQVSCRDSCCEIEFWPKDPQNTETYIAPSANRLVDRLSAQPGSEATPPKEYPLWDEINFPIDAVYTWVNGCDPAWLERKQQRLGEGSWPELSAGSARYEDREELRYSLRSVLCYLPWIRNIYIVTDGQTPAWFHASDARVKIVDHREIFPDPSALPTFNSHAIETCLHRIDGLSEHFIYFNDDTIVRRYLESSRFFTPNGLARFFPSPTKLNYLDDNAPHITAGRNNREVFRAAFGREITNSMLHTPHPHRRSVLYEIEDRFANEVEATRANPFRGDSDISMLSSFAQYYGYFTGRATPSRLATRYFHVTPEGLRRARWRLRDASAETFAFGESHDEFSTDDALNEMFTTLLHDIAPFPSPYEVRSVDR